MRNMPEPPTASDPTTPKPPDTNDGGRPLVSVIITMYNKERYIAEAVDSVFAQTYNTFEIVLIDDGSTDGGAAIVKGYPEKLRYHHQQNAGIAAALNCGVSRARGELIAFLDGDDVWLEHKLQAQVRLLLQHPEFDMVFAHLQQFISPDIDEAQRRRIVIPKEIVAGYFKGTLLIRRGALERVGPFDDQWKVGDFVDWYLRATDAGLRGHMMKDIVMKRRIHDNNMGIHQKDERTDFAKILKASLDRRRSAARDSSGK